jgi:hypothetical protein
VLARPEVELQRPVALELHDVLARLEAVRLDFAPLEGADRGAPEGYVAGDTPLGER